MPRLLVIGLVLAAAVLAAGLGCDRSQPQTPRDGPHTDVAKNSEAAGSNAHLQLTWQQAPGLPTNSTRRADVEEMATRFAHGLVDWIYGDRSRITVPETTNDVRHELVAHPPFVPQDQLGTSSGRVVSIAVALQTIRSGVLTVVVADGRTSYSLPASFARQQDRWTVTHLNNH